MGGLGSPPLHHQDVKRTKNSFCVKTPTDIPFPSSSGTLRNKDLERNDQSHWIVTEMESPGTSGLKSELHFNHVPCSEIGSYIQTNFQSERPKRLCTSKEFQTLQSLPDPRLPPTRRLAGKDRSYSSLFPSSNITIAQKIPKVGLPRRTLADDLPALRSIISPTKLFLPHQLDCRGASKDGHKSCGLLGRLPLSQPVSIPAKNPNLSGSAFSRASRLVYKLPKMYSGPIPKTGISGYHLGYSHQPEISIGGQMLRSLPSFASTEEVRQLFTQAGSRPLGSAQLRKLCDLSGSSALPNTSEILPADSAVQAVPASRASCCSSPGPAVVARHHRRDKSYSPYPVCSLPHYGCSRQRVGGTARRHTDCGSVGSRSDALALQPKGSIRSSSNDQTACPNSNRIQSVVTDRQQNSSSLYKQGRRYQVSEALESNQRAPEVRRLPRNRTDSSIYPGKIQRYCRPSFTGSTPSRMAPTRTRKGTDFPKVGPTSDRLIRVSIRSRSAKLRNARLNRLLSLLSQRVQSAMGLPTSMDIPASKSYTESACPPKHSKRNVSVSSAKVDKNFLEERHTDESETGTNKHRQFRDVPSGHINRATTTQMSPHPPRGLEDSWWEQVTKEWSHKERQLIRSSWRASTLKTYKPAWNRWLIWCKNNSVQPRNPPPEMVARYIAHLFINEGLSPKTILVHKSAIVSFCGSSPNADKINTNFLVKHTLKGISVAKGITKKPPIWDPRLVTEWLRQNPLKEMNLFEVSRRTAIILLMASGRRVQDLTLLRMATESFIDNKESIILIPAFGAKTDTSTHQQSGWKLSASENININPLFWLRKLIELSEPRRANLKELFITTTGEVKPASRAIIGGWIKSVLRDAKVEATPGSTRAAVASLNWLENYPIQDILSRGNWLSEQTFKKFYQRELPRRNYSQASLSSLFTPINEDHI